MGTPPSSRNCLGRSPPSRVPFPAATTMATFIRLRFGIRNPCEGRRGTHFAQSPARPLAVSGVLVLLTDSPEDHFACGGLQHAGDGDVRVLSDQAPRVI